MVLGSGENSGQWPDWYQPSCRAIEYVSSDTCVKVRVRLHFKDEALGNSFIDRHVLVDGVINRFKLGNVQVVGQTCNYDFWPQLLRASSLCDGFAIGRWYNELSTTRLVQLSTHNLTVAMFVRRVASGLAKRAAFRPVAARPFSSSFARCKPLHIAHTIDMTTQTHPLNYQSTPTATPSPANTPTKSSPSRVRSPTPAFPPHRPID